MSHNTDDRKRKISASMFGMVMLCFFLPFLTVSCPGTEMSFSGMQTTFGTTLEQPGLFGGKAEVHKVEGEWTGKLALLCACGGVILAFAARKNLFAGPLVAGGTGVFFLLLLRSRVNHEALKEGAGILQVSFDFGYWLAVLGFVAVTGLNLYFLIAEKMGHEKMAAFTQDLGIPVTGDGVTGDGSR